MKELNVHVLLDLSELLRVLQAPHSLKVQGLPIFARGSFQLKIAQREPYTRM